MAIALLALVPCVGTAVESASLITFSTVGPDCYADGTPVMDGEYYALVYQTTTAGDVQFTLGGEPVDAAQAVVLRALPRAKGGRCPSTTFAVDSDSLPKLTGTKVLRLYLLDTRVYVNGVATVGGLESVQASVPMAATSKVTTGSTKGELSVEGLQVSQLPAAEREPRITGITVTDDEVVLTVADAVEGVNYTAVEAKGASHGHQAVPATGVSGKPLQLKVRRGRSAAGLFKVQRK